MKIVISDGEQLWSINCTVLTLRGDLGTIAMSKQYNPLSYPSRYCFAVARDVVARRLALINMLLGEDVVSYPIEITDREPEYEELYNLLSYGRYEDDEYYGFITTDRKVNNVIIIEEDE